MHSALVSMMPNASSTCSAACTSDADDFSARILTAVVEASAATRSVHARNVSRRQRQYQRTCRKLKHGCVFLSKGWRVMLPKLLLPALGYTGSSAEVGVWHGHFSSIVVDGWKQARGTHFLVDPYRPVASCDALRRDKHCTLSAADFDEALAKAKAAIATAQARRPHARPVRFVRRDSLAAAPSVPDASLDFVYVDAAHDHHSVKMDLHAWARKVCPGGLLAGHDFSERGVASAVHEFLNRRRRLRGLPAPPSQLFADRLFVTAEHPSTWFVFRRTCGAGHGQQNAALRADEAWPSWRSRTT